MLITTLLSITIAMVGDMMPGTTYPTERLPKNDGKELFQHCDSVLQNADLAIGNLEGVLLTGGHSKDSGPNSYSFRIPPKYVDLFPAAGFDFLCIANNHQRDFGVAGYEASMKVLDSIGMPYAGLKGYASEAVVERDGIKYGLCAFGQNSFCYQHTDTATVRKILTDLRPKCDIMIVCMHGGAEGESAAHLPYGTEKYLGENRGSLREFAHFCIDLGADVIHGHGPHVPRAVELYKGRFIAYSLGNFCTPYGFNLKGMCGHATLVELKLNEDGSFVEGKIHSYIQKSGTGPQPDSKASALNDIRSLTEADIEDSALTFDDDGTIRIRQK